MEIETHKKIVKYSFLGMVILSFIAITIININDIYLSIAFGIIGGFAYKFGYKQNFSVDETINSLKSTERLMCITYTIQIFALHNIYTTYMIV